MTFSALPAPAEQATSRNGPGVARVSVIEGSAVVQRGDSHTQTAAVNNAPMLPGDYISTGKTSRAELEFDGYTAVRLGGNVQARITNNDPNNRTMQLADGTVEIGMVHDGQTIQVETPSVTVRARQAGDYRISIAADGSSWITARRGAVDVTTPHQTYALATGRTLVARGGSSNPTITYATEVAFDSFDDFNAERDRTMVAALNASPNLNPSIAGYDNLNAYGQWQDVSGYGQSWVPNEPSGWAPYRNGSWVWSGGYGWTWVGSEPWGWAPYHYGNWYWCGCGASGWAWLPPAYATTPAWSPALVGFFGFGASFGGPGWGASLGFGFPNVGWFPVAPFQPFYPWWPGWAWGGFGWTWPTVAFGFPGFFGTNVVNVTNITNITTINRIWRHGGVTGTTIGNFRRGTVFGHTVPVTARNIGRIGVFHGALPIAPTRANLAFSHGAVHAPVTFSKAFNSPRFATNRALAARNSFATQQKAVAQAFARGTIAGRAANTNVARANGMVTGHTNALVTRDNGGAGGHENARVIHADGMAGGHANAPSTSWQRFNNSRGIGMRSTGFATQSERGMSMGARQARMPSDSSGRFSAARGDSHGNGSAYSRSSYQRGPYSSHESIPSYAHQTPSYSRGSYPSYSRGSYPSYSRGSYPSYSRGSYPSYSRGSYGSAPSYPRGSYGSAPSYSRGAPGGGRPSGGGGGGGDRHGGGGRPPK